MNHCVQGQHPLCCNSCRIFFWDHLISMWGCHLCLSKMNSCVQGEHETLFSQLIMGRAFPWWVMGNHSCDTTIMSYKQQPHTELAFDVFFCYHILFMQHEYYLGDFGVNFQSIILHYPCRMHDTWYGSEWVTHTCIMILTLLKPWFKALKLTSWSSHQKYNRSFAK